jgi:hypothetical protein
MKKSSRIKQVLSLALVSIMAATAMPTLASATAEDYEQNVVTVQVNLGEGPGPGDELGCQGFASLGLPLETLEATFNGRTDGLDNPTLVQYLEWNGGYESGGFTNDDLANYLASAREGYGYLGFQGWETFSFETYPENATVENLEYISYTVSRNVVDGDGVVTGVENYFVNEDRNQDGRLDGSDAPEWLTATRRTYSTDWFELAYDADDCDDSDNLAFVSVGRGPAQRFDELANDWVLADVTILDENDSILEMAEANLMVRTKLLGGLISLPYAVAEWPFDPQEGYNFNLGIGPSEISPISFGDEGTAEMKAIMRIYGASPSGFYKTSYYYQLEVNDVDYFANTLFCGFFGLGNCQF